jgi:hypothetical protein
MADKADLRISDADREREAAVLREHYAAGRLDSSEFEERLQAVYGARTEGELESLRSDLPALPPKPPTTAELVRRAVTSNVMARNAGFGVGAFVACTAIWALTSTHDEFWPKWVLVFTLVTIMRGGSRGARRERRISQAGGGRITTGGSGVSGADGEGGGAGGDGHSYSYRYEYHHGHGHRHEHQHGGGEE